MLVEKRFFVNEGVNENNRKKDMDAQLKIKVNTLFEIIDELNYYQILRLSADCVQSEIEDGFQRQGNLYHPKHFEDANDELTTKGQYLLLSINESYQVLNEISGRLKYDQILGEKLLRIEHTKLLNAQESQTNNDPLQAATNESAKKYWALGLQAYDSGDFNSAVLQIKFAIQFEPNNEVFLEWLEKSEIEVKKAPKQTKNPYKLRL